MSLKNITPTKLDFDKSFDILSKNRKKLHMRRTLSGVLDLSSKKLHQKSFSSQFSSLSDDLHVEIQKIKEEVEARCAEQKQRETMLDSILVLDCSIQTDDVQIELGRDEHVKDVPGFFLLCKSWFVKCFKLVK